MGRCVFSMFNIVHVQYEPWIQMTIAFQTKMSFSLYMYCVLFQYQETLFEVT